MPGTETRTLPDHVLHRIGGGVNVVHVPNSAEETWRLWVEGDSFPRIVLDVIAGQVLVGTGGSAPTALGGSGSGAPTNASYITMVAESGLSAETVLSNVIRRDVVANRGAFGNPGVLFGATDTLIGYRDSGAAWDPYFAVLDSGGKITGSVLPAFGPGAVGPIGGATAVASVTTDATGRVSALTSTSIQIAESQVTSLVADLALKAPVASPTFTGVATSPAWATSGLTGATAASRYVGAVATVAPTTGTFLLGDFVIAQNGGLFICTTAGSPGTWSAVSGGGGLSTTLTSAHLYIGNGSNVATDTAVTGDVTISNAGVTAIGSAKVTNAMLAGSIDLTTKVTGALPIANGGTGQTSAGAALTALGGAPIASPTFTGVATSPAWSASGLTGATAGTRYVGATTSGAPASGTFVLGDFIVTQNGRIFVCTTAGSPGSWTDVGTGTGLSTTLTSAHIYVGNGSNVATDVAVTGDITISNAGVVAIGSAKVTNAMLAGSIDLTTKVTGTLPVANGGTGLATLTSNALYVGNGTSAITAITVGTNGQLLIGQTSAAPSFNTVTGDVTINASGVTAIGSAKVTNAMLAGSIDLTTKVTGTLPVGNGGTGQTAPTNHGVILGQGSSATVTTSAGTAGWALISGGSSADPAFGTQYQLVLAPSNQSWSGIAIPVTYAVSLVPGDLVYYSAADTVSKANASAIATAPVCGMALETASSGTHLILVFGIYRDDSRYNFTVNGLVYLSTTAGTETQTQPTATDQVIQVVGRALHADRIFFNPSMDYITHT